MTVEAKEKNAHHQPSDEGNIVNNRNSFVAKKDKDPKARQDKKDGRHSTPQTRQEKTAVSLGRSEEDDTRAAGKTTAAVSLGLPLRSVLRR